MKILCYTRQPMEDAIYSEKLAYSMHLAIQEDDGTITELNHNSGILYAKAVQNEDGTLHAKCLKNPWLFELADGSYGVIALRVEADGSEDESSRGKLLYCTSDDLIHYTEHPLLNLGGICSIEDAVCRFDREEGQYILSWRERNGKCFLLKTRRLDEKNLKNSWGSLTETEYIKKTIQLTLPAGTVLPEGAVLCNALDISQEMAEKLKCRFVTPVNTANEVPSYVRISGPKELAKVKARCVYSDGSFVEKRVDWYMDTIDWDTPGVYEVEGRIHQDHYEFPVAWHKADPCIGKWNGKYYFISTNDQDHEHSIYIREADSIPALVTAQQVKILDAYTYPHLGNLLWAPELHIIKNRLYVFHAGTPQEFLKEQSHVMALRKGGNPVKASDWEMPVRVLKKDGTPLYGEEGITLDMTVFEAGEKYYACWSQRQFKPVDQGAWLYIALLNAQEPWKLDSDPVLLSVPEYGWANNHTFVDEGPFALKYDGKIYLTFSSAAVDSTYVVGLLTAEETADLLDPSVWCKENCPLLSSRSVKGEYGTGHNAYVTDDDGLVWNTYHARLGVTGPRSSGIRRVHFNADGFPVLDMTEDKDLKPELASVRLLAEVVKEEN